MIIETKLLDEVFVINCKSFVDLRGSFIKVFQDKAFSDQGLDFNPYEIFISNSKKNVLRGMHYQSGLSAHEKLVYCSQGSLVDVIVDIRPQSSTFNQPVSLELNASDDYAIYIGKGFAHGFLSLSNNTSMIYCTSTMHNPSLDKGVLWSSINFDWPVSNPILSERDKNHPLINSLL